MANPAPNPYDFLPTVPSFELVSDHLVEGGTMAHDQVFNGFGLTGGNHSPHLRWSGAPEGTRSFAVTVFDPDAPTASGFWHWGVVNLPAEVTELPGGAGDGDESLPAGGAFHVRNDTGTRDYCGPAPLAAPKRHRYIFTVHAVDIDALDVTPDTTPAAVGFNLFFHTLGRAHLIAEYEIPEA